MKAGCKMFCEVNNKCRDLDENCGATCTEMLKLPMYQKVVNCGIFTDCTEYEDCIANGGTT